MSPCALQDYPQAPGALLSVGTLRRLFEAFPQRVAFRHEDCPALAKLSRVRAAVDATGRPIGIPTGNGGLHLRLELARGAPAMVASRPPLGEPKRLAIPPGSTVVAEVADSAKFGHDGDPHEPRVRV